MRKLLFCALFSVCALLMTAADQMAKPEPKITTEMREVYQQARADFLDYSARATDAKKRLDAAIKIMQDTCTLTQDEQGKIQCQPPTPKLEEKK